MGIRGPYWFLWAHDGGVCPDRSFFLVHAICTYTRGFVQPHRVGRGWTAFAMPPVLVYDEALFGFRQTDTGLLRYRCFDVEKGQAPGLGNLHVFDRIETIPSSVNIRMRCHLSPVMRWHWGLVLRLCCLQIGKCWRGEARKGERLCGAVQCDAV